MIQTLVLDRESRTFTRVPETDAINGLCSNASKIVWVDVSDPTSQDFDSLAKQFGFHPLSIEDCRHQHQRPKVEEFPGYYFIVLYEADLNEAGRLHLGELGIFLGKNYLVTVHSQPIRAIETAERLWRSWTDLAERGTGLLAYFLIDAIVDDYLPLLDALSDRMDSLEDQIFADFQAESLEEIFRIKKELLHLASCCHATARCLQHTSAAGTANLFAGNPHLLPGCLRSFDSCCGHDRHATGHDRLDDGRLPLHLRQPYELDHEKTDLDIHDSDVGHARGWNLRHEFRLHARVEMEVRICGRAPIYGRCGSGDLFLLSKDQMAMRQAGHQHRREDELDFRETEKSNPSRSREEKSALDDTQEAGDSSRVVLVIVALALVFIAIITYFVAQMPHETLKPLKP